MELKNIRDAVVAQVVQHAQLAASSLESIKALRTADAAVQKLVSIGALTDALRLLAHALPKREGVWWACTCSRASTHDLRADDLGAIIAAERWVYDETDESARAAYEFAERLGFKTPAGWAAVAAMWSSSSLAPPGQAILPPAPYLTGVAVSGAVMLAAVIEPVVEMEARQKRFLEYGFEIANGGHARRADGSPR